MFETELSEKMVITLNYYLNKLLDSNRIILYTWTVAGDGG